MYGVEMTVVHFPADRRTADVRRCADALERLHGEEANRFWRTEMVSFAGNLRDKGMADEEISHQAALFMHAVQMELQMGYAAEGASA
jgi:hypothetical protein